MSEQAKSEQACPVCSQHTLALDKPPELDVMGVQAYSDMLGMGDVHNHRPLGIVCLNCRTHWQDKAAFDRGEPDPDVVDDAPGDLAFGDDDDADAEGGGGGDDDAGGAGGGAGGAEPG